MKVAKNSPADWGRVVTEDGSVTLTHPGHGEACHSTVGALLESRERYVNGCQLVERWRREPERRLRILDIGTGLGWNLAATLQERSKLRQPPPLDLVTLELSAEVIDAARQLQAELPQGEHFATVHEGLAEVLPWSPGSSVELEPGVSLSLWLGDARLAIESLAGQHFDAFYLDPFSPRRDPALWSLEFFRGLAALAAPGALLATYSAATQVRAGLLAAGWCVGPGPRIGSKAEGTLASMGAELPSPFTPKVERRIARRARELNQAGPPPEPTA